MHVLVHCGEEGLIDCGGNRPHSFGVCVLDPRLISGTFAWRGGQCKLLGTPVGMAGAASVALYSAGSLGDESGPP